MNDRTEQISRLFEDEAANVERAVAARAGGASAADVEDACATAWAVLFRREDIDPLGPRTVSFLVVVATHEAWRLVRRQRERPTYDPQDTPEPESGQADVLEVVLDRETLALIDTLPERQRLVISLRAQGLSREDMAEVTGWTLRTVDRQMYRALAALRKQRE